MSLSKSNGNMYPWVTHMHSHLRGKCSHGCSYCYVQAHERRWRTGAFAGELRLLGAELNVSYGSGRTIFIEHQNDLFAGDVPDHDIMAILRHCNQYRFNTYVFQTKNPARMSLWTQSLPPWSMLGCTIESNRHDLAVMGMVAPEPAERAAAMEALPTRFLRFITVEPILDFDLVRLASWLRDIHPDFVNIGADSKGHNLPEPPADKVRKLIAFLANEGIEVRGKHNLERLLGKEAGR